MFQLKLFKFSLKILIFIQLCTFFQGLSFSVEKKCIECNLIFLFGIVRLFYNHLITTENVKCNLKETPRDICNSILTDRSIVLECGEVYFKMEYTSDKRDNSRFLENKLTLLLLTNNC